MINFTSSDSGWTSISTGNFGQNVEFFYYNGTVIPSWLENYTANHAIWWLKLGSIPASSSITVYIGIAPTSTNLFNTVNDGEAPQLSSTYAQYDDGANIFNLYTNWAGTSAPSGWTLASSSDGAASVNNGLTIKTGDVDDSSYGYAVYSAGTFSNMIISSYVSAVSISSTAGGMTGNPAAFSSSTSPSPNTAPECNNFGYVVGLSVCQTSGGGSLYLLFAVRNYTRRFFSKFWRMGKTRSLVLSSQRFYRLC